MTQPVYSTDGGYRTATSYSGAVAPGLTASPGAVAVGADVLLFSGAGRINQVIQLAQLVSGVAVTFYDAGAPVSGGPIYASGHKQLFQIPPTWSAILSGVASPYTAQPFQLDVPFQSGLCFNSRSGQPGFTVTYTPETAGQ